MRFRILGPLEVVTDDQPIVLGGIKQRATLGYLLLHINRVVAISELLEALWAGGEAPATARKILQNAVWGLRGTLSLGGGSSGRGILLTKAPGYLLRVDADQVDLHLFRKRMQEGREKLASGSPAKAAEILRDALALWRGPALADLTEAGIVWPELTAVENARLDAMEDYFEAELACGRHQAALNQLETMVEAEPLRERLCGQLMLALYRCGRQADALNVYSRVRSKLMEELGLEPRRELQMLQMGILNQDASLSLPGSPVSPEVITLNGSTAPKNMDVPAAPMGASAAPRMQIAPVDQHNNAHVMSAGPNSPERKQETASVLLVQTTIDFESGSLSFEQIYNIRDRVDRKIRETVKMFGGTVTSSIGLVSVASFESSPECVNQAERAVRAAIAIRSGLSDLMSSVGVGDLPSGGLTVQAAVTTGKTTQRIQVGVDGTPQPTNSALLEKCHSQLLLTPADQIWVCDYTRQATTSSIVYERVSDHPPMWQVRETLSRLGRANPSGRIDHELELNILRGLLDHVRYRATPHLATVLGDPGVGKTQLLLEFERRAMGQSSDAQFIVSTVPFFTKENNLAFQASLLLSYCGITPSLPVEAAREKLSKVVRHVVHSEETSWLLSALDRLLFPGEQRSPQISTEEMLDASRRFLIEIARCHPLVIIIDDLHHADGSLLSFIEELSNAPQGVSLLVIAAARPTLLNRSPKWGGGMRRFTMITLDSPVVDIMPHPVFAQHHPRRTIKRPFDPSWTSPPAELRKPLTISGGDRACPESRTA